MSVTALTPAEFDRFYESGRAGAREMIADDIFRDGLTAALGRARKADKRMTINAGSLCAYEMGWLFEIRRFLDRHSPSPVHALDRVDPDAFVDPNAPAERK